MKVEARLVRNGTAAAHRLFRLFLFRLFFPHCDVQWKKKGRRREEEPESRVEPEPETIVCMLRAFDFSRRNDYAIISRRVPFLLKRKTSPFPLALPSLYAISRACLSRSLSMARSFSSLYLSLSLSLSPSIDVTSFRHDSCWRPIERVVCTSDQLVNHSTRHLRT